MLILLRLRKASPTIKQASAFIKSYSCVTAFGLTEDALWDACHKGVKGFARGLLQIPSAVSEECLKQLAPLKTSTQFSGVEKNELLAWSLHAVQEALRTSGWEHLDDEVGVILATTTGLTKNWEEELMGHFRSQDVSGHVYHPLGSFAAELQHQWGHNGPIQLVSSACCAGTQAMGMGQKWLQNGYVKKCIVLGAEQICQLTDSGFHSLSLVNGENCFPFNETHNNICLSEAVAAICLDTDPTGALAEIIGFGCASDGYSMTAPKPDGSGPKAAMKAALQEAELNPQDLDWVHAHGTGSVQNDRAEAAAIKQLEINCPVTSTKGVHGHSLAASGVLESILCVMAMQRQQLLPTWGCEPKHFNINLETGAKKKPIQRVLKNTLGFGGINSSLIFQKVGLDA